MTVGVLGWTVGVLSNHAYDASALATPGLTEWGILVSHTSHMAPATGGSGSHQCDPHTWLWAVICALHLWHTGGKRKLEHASHHHKDRREGVSCSCTFRLPKRVGLLQKGVMNCSLLGAEQSFLWAEPSATLRCPWLPSFHTPSKYLFSSIYLLFLQDLHKQLEAAISAFHGTEVSMHACRLLCEGGVLTVCAPLSAMSTPTSLHTCRTPSSTPAASMPTQGCLRRCSALRMQVGYEHGAQHSLLLLIGKRWQQ